MDGRPASDGTAAEAPVSDRDRELILGAATDHIESWLEGDAERMARCCTPTWSRETLTHPRMQVDVARIR